MSPEDQEIDRLAHALGALRSPPDEDDVDLELLQAYHAGTLDEAQVATVEGVLAADPAARAFLEELDEAPSEFSLAWATKHGLGAVGQGGSAPQGKQGGKLIRLVWPTVVAMAAAALLYVNWPADTPREVGAPPPGYALTLMQGDVKELRSSDPSPDDLGQGPFTVDDGITMQVGLAPEVDPTGTVVARAFVDGADGTLEPAAEQGTLTPGGAWRIKASTRKLFGERYGARTLHVAFAYDGTNLDDLAGRPLSSAASKAGGVQWMTVQFVYRAEGSE